MNVFPPLQFLVLSVIPKSFGRFVIESISPTPPFLPPFLFPLASSFSFSELAILEFISSSPKSIHVFLLLDFSALLIIFRLSTLEGENLALSLPVSTTNAHLSHFPALLPL